MTYILPVLYVIVSYTFFLLAVCFGNAITLQIVSILLPFIMGIVNLIVVANGSPIRGAGERQRD